jgi:hypothetical protein
MHKAMHDAILGVEFLDDLFQQPCVATFISTENGICDQIRKLEEPCCLRVCEERNIREILHGASVSCAEDSIFRQQRLQTGFVTAFIENDETALRIALRVKATQEQIAAVANLFKGTCYRIFGRGLFKSYSEQGYVTRADNVAQTINDFISLHRWARMPWLFLVRRNCLCVELDVTGWEVSLREFVYFVIDPVNFAFKYGNTPKDEVLVLDAVRVS